jgi:hypothetical protein
MMGMMLVISPCTLGAVSSKSISFRGLAEIDEEFLMILVMLGDFQWPKMRLSAEDWHENTRSWLEPDAGRLLYIATDETNRTFFRPLMEHYNVRFLDDYSSLAGLADVDPNFVGMIDQVVASRGRVFVGTYFSSFSAYIGRMRGYHGLSGKRMFYSHPKYWNETHSWGKDDTDFLAF